MITTDTDFAKIEGRNIKDLLTSAQFRVADKVGDGLTNKQVAKELGITERTVHNHLYMIYKDLKIISRYKLISMVLTSRLKNTNMDFTEIEKRMIESIKKNESIDIHGERAALYFKIPVEEVTAEQRKIGKYLNFFNMHGRTETFTVTGRFIKRDELKFINIKGKD